MSQQEAKWYVVHTYSGYENKVKEDLEKSVENAGLADIILEVKYPTEETIEILPTGKRKTTTRKVFPGYVMVKMLVDVVEKERPAERGDGISRELVMNPRAWYVIRNTRGVTGFVGSGNKATPLSETDFASIFDTAPQTRIDIQVGDEVRILTGLFENFTGKVTAIDPVSQQLSVTVPMLKRETSVELAYDEVVRVD